MFISKLVFSNVCLTSIYSGIAGSDSNQGGEWGAGGGRESSYIFQGYLIFKQMEHLLSITERKMLQFQHLSANADTHIKSKALYPSSHKRNNLI